MFHSGRHDDYYGTLRPLIYDAYRDVRTPPSARDGLAKAGAAYGHDYTSLALESIALLEGVNLLATIAVQNHAGMTSACREEALEAVPGRRADCRAYFERVAEGSEHFMGKKTAYSKLADLAESDAAKQPWLDATRKLDWLIAQHAELSNSPENLTRYLERMFQEGEIAAAEHVLRANDIPIEPPADWDASSYWQKYMEEAGIDLPTEATGEVSDRMD